MGSFIVGDRVAYFGREARVVFDGIGICDHYLLKFDDGEGWRGTNNHHVMHNERLHHLRDETGLWWCRPGDIKLLTGKDEYEIDE